MHSRNGPSQGFLYPVEYSFIAVAVKFAAQDTAAPEPGVDIDDLVMSSNPFYGPAFGTTATLIASAKWHCTHASQTPGAYTSFMCEFPDSPAMVTHELRVDASQHHYVVMRG